MEQADRSGKQNIVEASQEKSLKMNIKLTGVARASYAELLEDYKDFARLNNLAIWPKDDERLAKLRAWHLDPKAQNWSNLSNWTHWTNSDERFVNCMLTLISKECYLLDKLLQSLEQKFVSEGGYTENLFKKRLEYRRKKGSNQANWSNWTNVAALKCCELFRHPHDGVLQILFIEVGAGDDTAIVDRRRGTRRGIAGQG